MKQKLNATQAYIRVCYESFEMGEPNPGDIALLKVQASETMEFCAREAMQILGGMGYMRGSRVERIYREVRVNAIGGGSEEIMRDLASRQYGVYPTQDETMKLWHCKGARSLRPLWTLEELGLDNRSRSLGFGRYSVQNAPKHAAVSKIGVSKPFRVGYAPGAAAAGMASFTHPAQGKDQRVELQCAGGQP